MSTDVGEYTVHELSIFNDETGVEQLRFTTESDSRYPVRFQGFEETRSKTVVDIDLLRSEVRELRDFLNSLDLD